MASNLPHLPSVERLSPRVLRILGSNPGKFTLQGTNTYLIGRGPSRTLLDTGQGFSGWLDSLKSVLASENAVVKDCLLSHWHGDHIQGVPQLASISPNTVIHKHTPMFHGTPEWRPIEDGQKYEVEEGTTLRAVHCPGHTTDHVGFVLEEEDSMFTADNVLGHGTAVFEDLTSYLNSLERMGAEFSGRAYPGHGAVIEDGPSRIKEYIAHRREREAQIVAALRGLEANAQGNGGQTSMQIVKVVYKDVPEALHIPAEGGVRQVLYKLKTDGKVSSDENGEKWRLCDSASL